MHHVWLTMTGTALLPRRNLTSIHWGLLACSESPHLEVVRIGLIVNNDLYSRKGISGGRLTWKSDAAAA
jgi:hypothetical protein